MMVRVLTLLSVLTYAVTGYAITECEPAEINGVQVTDTNVVVKTNNEWHLVGVFSDPGMKEKLSLLLAAHASGKEVVLKFIGDGYNCNQQTFSSRLYAAQIVE